MRSISLALLLAITPQLAWAQAPAAAPPVEPSLVFAAPVAPPEKFVRMGWRFADKLTLGYFFTDAQVQAIDLRISTAESKASDAAVAKLLPSDKPSWLWGLGGLIVGGLVVGIAAKAL